MTNTITETRIANFTASAAALRAFAERQEARAPGRMDHVTGPALEGARLAEAAADAYRSGDKAAASAARAAFGEHMSRHQSLAIVAAS